MAGQIRSSQLPVFAVGLVAAASLWTTLTYASSGDDRGAAGMQELGISEQFGLWPGGIVLWQYNPSNADPFHADEAAFVELLQEVIDEIENAAGVDFQYQGIHSSADPLNFADNVVTVGWADLGGAAGLAGPAQSCTGLQLTALGYCQYVDGSVRFNNNQAGVDWDQGDVEASQRLLIQVALHELLHLLGIGHSDNPISVMYANPYTNLHFLRADDLEVLRSMYGPSDTPSSPSTYSAPTDQAVNVVQNSYLSTDGGFPNPISSVADGETDSWVGLTWEEKQGAHAPIHMVLTDPSGHYYEKRVEFEDCPFSPPSYCINWLSLVSMDTLRTYPGTWTVYVIVDDDLEAIHVLDNQFTAPVTNQAPDSQAAFDVTEGEAPLAVSAAVTSYGDAEADTVSVTWHIPTVGEIDIDFGASTGQNRQQFELTSDGRYEVYVEVTDDAPRYGTPGAGDAAGAGFRQLYRQIITVGDKPLIVGLDDINGNGTSEVAVVIKDLISGNYVLHVRDSESDSLIQSVSLGSEKLTAIVTLDANNDGSVDIASLQTMPDGNVRVRVRNIQTGAILNTAFYGKLYTAIDLAIMSDLDGNNYPEIAVLGKDSSDGLRVQARDSMTDSVTSTTYFGANAFPVDLEIISNYVAGTIPAVAVHARVWASNQTRTQLRNAVTGAFIRNIFFGSAYAPIDTIVIGDISGDAVPDLAQLARRIDNGASRIQVKASDSGTTISNAFTGDTNIPISITSINDINGNGSPEIALLVANPAGVAQITVWDSATGSFVRNVFTAAVGSPYGVAVLSDGTDAGDSEEIAVLGDNAGQRRVQVKDTGNGTQINTLNFP